MVSKAPFLWLGEHLALDFLNTEPIVNGERVELLASFERLVAWCEEAKLTSRSVTRDALRRWDDSPGAERTLAMAHQLRRDVRLVVESRSAGKQPTRGALGSLNACLRL